MKKTLLSLGLLFMTISYAFCTSPGYYYYTSQGTSLPFYWQPSAEGITPTPIINAPADDVLSGAQTLPFAWSFYGQTVNTYKASDNGYITFDPNATQSANTSMKLPDTTAPKNAIFAFWTNLTVPNNAGPNPAQSVRYYTYGSAPNRVYVIEWYYVMAKGASWTGNNFFIFSLRLYESGGFDVVHTADLGNVNNALIGCQNADGTLATMVNGSPYLGGPNPSGSGANSADLVYNFKFGVQPPLDLHVLNISASSSNTMYRRTVPTFVLGDNAMVGGNIANYGALNIKSYTVNYTVDGGTTQSYKVTGASVASNGGTSNFTHNTPWKVAGVGKFHTIKAWVSNVNDTFNPPVGTADTTNIQLFVINGGTNNVTKKTLVEEGTGAWCGYCPHAHLALRQFENNDPDVVEISNHNSDAMATPNGNAINNVYSPNSYPFITIDRHLFDGEAVVAPAISTVDYASTWQPLVSQESSVGSVPVSMGILQKTYDPDTRKINLTLTGQFYDYVGGDIRVTVALCENRVRGPHSDPDTAGVNAWSQHNYYSSKWASVGGTSDSLYNEPARINGYFHDHVARAYFTSNAFGDPLLSAGSNVIATPGQTFSKTYSMTVPLYGTNTGATVDYSASRLYTDDQPNYADEYYSSKPGEAYNKWQDMYLVAFVSMYNPNDPTYCEVLNAYQVPLVGWSAGVDPASKQINDIDLFPNPTTGNTVLNYSLTHASNVTIDVYDMMGHKVAQVQNGNQTAGNQSVTINAASYTNGLYFATITSNGVQAAKKFMVQK